MFLIKFNYQYILLGGLVIFTMTGCRKFISVSAPRNKLITSSVFADEQTATAAMTGIYGNMYGNYGFAGQTLASISLMAGLASDELTNYSVNASQTEFYKNALTRNNNEIAQYLWGQPYQDIYDANAIIEGLKSSKTISNAVKQELNGEAKFLRAFCYFYLVNSFGDVPLITTTNYSLNASPVRSPSSEVYQQIIADCKDAQGLLSDDYSLFAGERIRPVKAAATALLARTYLYQQDWSKAETQSSAVIENTSTYSIVNLDSVFFKNSQEAIWQFQPVISGQNTNEGNYFILLDPPTTAALSDQLISAFEPGDIRRIKWIDSLSANGNVFYYPFKYKVKTSSPITEYSMVMRLAEQYLIRAEARARQGDIAGAIDDLNTIRNRAGLDNYSGLTDNTSLMTAILHERQCELFTEWGNRWFDLKRTNSIDSVMINASALKGGNWESYKRLFPIPQSEISKNSNISQNDGY